MSQMIRKQVYLQKRQQVLLQRLARRRGISEAEVIRQAIDLQAQSAANQPLPPDPVLATPVIRRRSWPSPA